MMVVVDIVLPRSLNTHNEGAYSPESTILKQTEISISGSTESEGVSGTGANLPPYYALAFIMRVS